MSTRRELLVIVGACAAVSVAWALGAPTGTILIAGAALLCLAAMLLGVGAMANQHTCRHCAASGRSKDTGAETQEIALQGREAVQV